MKDATKSWLNNEGFDSGWLMDKSNNIIGIQLAENKPGLSSTNLGKEIQKIVNEGNFYIEDGKTLYKDSDQQTKSPGIGT